MFCPACKAMMVVLELHDIEVDYCPACRGCWLDAGELGLILRGDTGFDHAPLLRDVRKSGRRCPVCSVRMREALFAESGVRVDHCPMRHGIWLDAGELKAIIETVAEPDRVAALARHCDEVFGEAVKGERI
ncbi:MAG: zf-TFIIB domain-containing protein [bacterium]